MRTVDRGVAFRERRRAGATALTAGGATIGPRGHGALAAEGRVREALVAAARGAVAARDRALFDRFATRTSCRWPRSARRSGAKRSRRRRTRPFASVLDALVCGADAAACLRALASVLPGYQPAAAELVEASLLLAPERRMTHLTRALLRFQRGDQAGALADADVVAEESAEARRIPAFVRGDRVSRVRRLARAGDASRPIRSSRACRWNPAHSVDEVRHVVGVYATRLAQARAAVRALVGADRGATLVAARSRRTCCRRARSPCGTRPWNAIRTRRRTRPDGPRGMPSDGPAEGASGAAPETIEIDERLVADGAGVPALLTAAHADWSALSWLCWAVGLDDVALPEDGARPTRSSPSR